MNKAFSTCDLNYGNIVQKKTKTTGKRFIVVLTYIYSSNIFQIQHILETLQISSPFAKITIEATVSLHANIDGFLEQLH